MLSIRDVFVGLLFIIFVAGLCKDFDNKNKGISVSYSDHRGTTAAKFAKYGLN